MAFLDLSGLQRFKTKLESLFVKGPASATANRVATFDGTTGKVIKDSGYTIATSVPSGAVFTDTKVTSSANHYTPATVSGSDKTASASGATAAWSIDVVKGVTLNTDGKGHVTGVSVTSGKIPANPNTDTKVRQTLVTSDNTNRPLLLAYSDTSTTTANVDNVSYRANTIYANQSTGTVTATNFAGKINNHTVNKDVPSDAKFTDTTYSAATQSAAGLMSAADKTKLDGVTTSDDTIVSNIAGVKSALTSFASNMSVGESKLVRITHTDNSYSEIMEPNVKYSGYLIKNDSNNFSWLASGYLVKEPVIFSYFSTAQYWISEKLAINSELNSNLTILNSRFITITSGSLRDIRGPGIYYVSGSVADKPSGNGGLYVVTTNGSLIAGVFVDVVTGKTYSTAFYSNNWTYSEFALNDKVRNSVHNIVDMYTNKSKTEIANDLKSKYSGSWSAVVAIANATDGTTTGIYMAVNNGNYSGSVQFFLLGS